MACEKEEDLQQLDEQLEWVKYRLKMLDIMEKKLCDMKKVAVNASKDIDIQERIELNRKMENLQSQVNALDEESRCE